MSKTIFLQGESTTLKNYPEYKIFENEQISGATFSKKIRNFEKRSLGWNQKCDTKLRKRIVVEKQLAVVLSRLSTGNSYRKIYREFGVGKSTIPSIY